MQSNQTNQQGQVKFMVGDKVKYKKGFASRFHDPEDTYTVEEIQSETDVAFVESNYVAHQNNLELVSRQTKHKHHDLIIEWTKDPANVIVQYRGPEGGWRDAARNSPSWDINTEYRIKPKTKQVTRWKWAFLSYDQHVMESYGYYTEEEAIEEFPRATPYKLEHTAITETEEV